MAFNTETARLAGQKSKRGKSRLNGEIQEKIHALLAAYTEEQMIDDLNNLKPKERLWVLHGLSEYVIPKLQRSEVEQTTTIDLSLLTEDELRAVSTLIDKVG